VISILSNVPDPKEHGMSTATDYQELTRRTQEQFLEAVRESQQAIADAVGAWAQAFQSYSTTAPAIPGTEQLPTPDSVIDDTFDLVETLVKGQREFAHKLVAATAPAREPSSSATK
jgi:hypothetical protein